MPHRIILVSQWYPPEQAPIGHMVRELGMGLAARGWDVTVITGFPNHPGGEVFGGYKKRWKLEENVDGMRVVRVWLATSKNRSKLNRVLTFITFTVTSALAILKEKNPEAIFAVFQPLSVGIVLPLLARLKRARLVLNVQDLHPDVPIELGLLTNPLLIRILRGVEKHGYKRADRLTVISESFRDHCLIKGANPAHVHVIQNWIDLAEVTPGDRDTALRRECGFTEKDIVVLYAGTIGWVSGADVVISVAKRLEQRSDIKFLFVGGGPMVQPLKERAQADGLRNVIFLPFQDRARLSEVQASSDISLVTLAPGKGRTSVPSKVLGYMAAARPVIASVDKECETAHAIRSSRCGVVVESADPVELADAILDLAADPKRRAELGRNGRCFAETNLAKETVVENYAALLQESVEQGA